MKQKYKKLLILLVILASVASSVQYTLFTAVQAKAATTEKIPANKNANKNKSAVYIYNQGHRSNSIGLQVLPLAVKTAIQQTADQNLILPVAMNMVVFQPTASEAVLAVGQKSSTPVQQVETALSVHSFVSLFALNVIDSPGVLQNREFAENIPMREQSLPAGPDYYLTYGVRDTYEVDSSKTSSSIAIRSKASTIPDMTVVLRC